MKPASLILLGAVSVLLGGCAVYGPPPAYNGYYERPYYAQPGPVYSSGPVYYQAPQPVYVGPPVILDFGFGFRGGRGGYGGGWGGHR
ncbi:hypothetical protein QN362_16850 [Actimicrobium sp. CCC2.4]|uniref:hypothetical protein n=1 Tax=Actimicrobium sp. CCC2.4 TaxID=3048606 RepID=UPI002AC9015B|nr:hypothetical protein [Actimicrobium sp. CCC2.4]MEB0137007.1 hypothetical protein [Actimicrobium sp. CCC2.4]WPX32255.1 hypothetical protein RHM62_18865 [Actimicrobium sp. CCC2.4]